MYWRLWRMGEELSRVDGIQPVLASWNAKTDPDQVRLQAYLDDVISRLGSLPQYDTPLFLHMEIDVKEPTTLVRHHDLENYLTPLFGAQRLDPRRFVLVSAVKRVGGGSRIILGVAQAQEAPADMTSFGHFASAMPGNAYAKAWKDSLRKALAEAKPAAPAPGPLEVHLAWRCPKKHRRNWALFWKPTGRGRFATGSPTGASRTLRLHGFGPNLP